MFCGENALTSAEPEIKINVACFGTGENILLICI